MTLLIFKERFTNKIPLNVHSILVTEDCSLPKIRKRSNTVKGRDSLCVAWNLQCQFPKLCVFPLEAWALRTEPFGKKVLCSPNVSALSPELLHSFSEHDSQLWRDGPWVCLFLLLPSFLNGPRGKGWETPATLCRSLRKLSTKSVFWSFWT